MDECTTAHFSNLLGMPNPSDYKPNISPLFPSTTSNPHHNYSMPHEFPLSLVDGNSIIELCEAIFSMSKHKTTGLNDLEIEFFQTYWEIIWENLFRVGSMFHKNILDLWHINQTYISLIPKSNFASSISDFKSISVIFAIPKIITKS
jgi:hypothetical protein